MAASVPLVLMIGFGTATSLVARRKGRSTAWWFLGGVVAGLPALILAAVATPAGEPWRFRRPLVVSILGVALVGSLVLLAVAAQLVG
ncbi:MAG TPA: hypothetical protein VH108_03380 [Gaiellaceae bacterium]|nr:hypothetical protein [Gaiellaceae bacterium]